MPFLSSHRIKKHLSQYWPMYGILIICAIVIIANFKPNTIIMGLDNSSPYFEPAKLLALINEKRLFIYSGALFSVPFFAVLDALRMPPETMSYLYLFFCFGVGISGIALLSYSIIRRVESKSPYALASGIASIGYICSLFTIWIFAHPNFLFLAAYGSIPWIVFLLSLRINPLKVWFLAAIALFSILFLFTSQNIVAFALYAAQIVILTFVISQVKEKGNALQVLKKPVLWAGAIFAIWIVSLQAQSLLQHDSGTIFTHLGSYINEIPTSLMEDIRTDIVASESGNDFLNSARFALGWMELHTPSGSTVFQFYDLYKHNLLFITIGLIPFLLSLGYLALISTNGKKQKLDTVLPLFVTLFVGLFLISKYSIPIIQTIPYISDLLRWASSKLWPLFMIPLALTSGLGAAALFSYVRAKKFTLPLKIRPELLLFSVLALLLLAYGFPLYTGHLIGPTAKVSLPQEYQNLADSIPKESTVLYVPPPQLSYFREYGWGYYGSDFLTYVTHAYVVDRANLYEYGDSYDEYVEALQTCNSDMPSDIDFILVDKTATNSEGNYEQCLSNKSLTVSNSYFNLYEQ